MSIQSSVTLFYQAVGALGGADNLTASMVTPTNNNAPPPYAAQLQVGANTVLVPQGFTCNVLMLRPPGNSTNAKTLKGVSGDTGIAGWTSQPLCIPCTGLTSIVIVSTSTETIEINPS